MAIASLTIGIALFVTLIAGVVVPGVQIPLTTVLFPAAFVGFVLSILPIRRRTRRRIAITGMVLCLLTIFGPWILLSLV